MLPIVSGLKLSFVAVCGMVSSADSPTATKLLSDSDGSLFRNVTNNEHHFLYNKLLPEKTTHGYNLRQRPYVEC